MLDRHDTAAALASMGGEVEVSWTSHLATLHFVKWLHVKVKFCSQWWTYKELSATLQLLSALWSILASFSSLSLCVLQLQLQCLGSVSVLSSMLFSSISPIQDTGTCLPCCCEWLRWLFAVLAPQWWNKVPIDVKTAETLHMFTGRNLYLLLFLNIALEAVQHIWWSLCTCIIRAIIELYPRVWMLIL